MPDEGLTWITSTVNDLDTELDDQAFYKSLTSISQDELTIAWWSWPSIIWTVLYVVRTALRIAEGRSAIESEVWVCSDAR